eukprot:m.255298 g.255298  ORF g.255298 m.255298 type:complete len:2095 (-) comp15497_c0_seq1:1040-7324(-)
MASVVFNDVSEDLIEQFVLSQDRPSFLKTLVKGSREHAVLAIIHALSNGNTAEAKALLESAKTLHLSSTSLLELRLLAQQCANAKEKSKALKKLKEIFNIRDPPPASANARGSSRAQSRHPQASSGSTLNQDLLSLSAMLKERTFEPQEFTQSGCIALLEKDLSLNQLKQLLLATQHSPFPQGHPKIVGAVERVLKNDAKVKFEHLVNVTNWLPSQLSTLLAQVPELISNSAFVSAYLTSLSVPLELWETDLEAQQNYFETVLAFTAKLPTSFAAFKASALLFYLQFLVNRFEIYDLDLLQQFLNFPAAWNYARIQASSFKQAIRSYSLPNMPMLTVDLQSFLTDFFVYAFATPELTTIAPFDQYVSDRFLKPILATTKLMSGLDSPEFVAMYNGDLEVLRNRVKIDFVPQNRNFFDVSETPEVTVMLKNTPQLLMRVYSINTFNFFSPANAPNTVPNSINVDGLVPNLQTTINVDLPPIQMVRKTFELPQLTQRGVYLVDLTANGHTSRAIIRKGRLYHTQQLDATGYVVKVFNEHNTHVTTATVHMGGTTYTPNEAGEVILPPPSDSSMHMVLCDGDFCRPATLRYSEFEYSMSADVVLSVEDCIAGNFNARALVRPTLYIGSTTPVTLKHLRDTRVCVRFSGKDGTLTQAEEDVELSDTQELVVPLQVPDNATDVSIVLSGTVTRHNGTPLVLSHKFSKGLNGINATAATCDVVLNETANGFVLRGVGKNGEVRSGLAVELSLDHIYCQFPINAQLATDEQGLVHLGPLPNVRWITVSTSNTMQTFLLPLAAHTYPYDLIVDSSVGFTLPLPLDDTSPAATLVAQGKQDLTAKLQRGTGFLTIPADLALGTYTLYISSSLRVSAATVQVHVVAPPNSSSAPTPCKLKLPEGATHPGSFIRLPPFQAATPTPLCVAIQKLSVSEDGLTLGLLNASPTTRVHVVVPNCIQSNNDVCFPTRVPATESITKSQLPRTNFMSGGVQSDELRYVSKRKQLPSQLGNMLQKPDLLVHPHELGETMTRKEQLRDAVAMQEMAQGAACYRATNAMDGHSMMMHEKHRAGRIRSSTTPCLDWLASAPAIVYNLVPDANGMISVDAVALGSSGARAFISVQDYHSTLTTSCSLAGLKGDAHSGAASPATRDIRASGKLDPKTPYAEQRHVETLQAGQAFDLSSSASAFKAVADLPTLFSLVRTLCPSEDLARFSFLAKWTTLSFDDKCAKYSEFACHELDLFLMLKDAPFYTQVVLPLIECKLCPDLVDRALLDCLEPEDAAPSQVMHYNALERVLLSMRGAVDANGFVQCLAGMLPETPDEQRFSALFDTVLRSSVGESFDFEEEEDDWDGDMMPADDMMDLMGSTSPRAPMPMMAQCMSLSAAPPQMAKSMRMPARARRAAAPGAMPAVQAKRVAPPPMRQVPGATKEYAERSYFNKHASQSSTSAVTPSRFFVDVASSIASSGSLACLSKYWIESCNTITDALLVLALTDLPFANNLSFTDVTVTGQGNLFVFANQFLSVPRSTLVPAPVQVFQTVAPDSSEPIQVADGVHTVERLAKYKINIVCSNVTSKRQAIKLLYQVPTGAIAISNTEQTKSIALHLQPYSIHTTTIYFYFPASGNFTGYPACATLKGECLGMADPLCFSVTDQLDAVDSTNWDAVAARGTEEQVINFICNEPRHKWNNIYQLEWRCNSKQFFTALVKELRTRGFFDRAIWQHAFMHEDMQAISEYCGVFAHRFGSELDSPIIRTRFSTSFNHHDFSPVINARVHPIGQGEQQILNDSVLARKREVLQAIVFAKDIPSKACPELAYFRLLADDVANARSLVDRAKAAMASKPSTRWIQLDYMDAYLDFYSDATEDGTVLSTARQIVAKYSDLKVTHWQAKFAKIAKMIDEVDQSVVALPTGKVNPIQQYPSLALSVKDNVVTIDYAQLPAACTINYYVIDTEVLFSSRPFAQNQDSFAFIQPNHSASVELPVDCNTTSFTIPPKLSKESLLIEAKAAGTSKTIGYYPATLVCHVMESYGQVRITTRNGAAIPRCYVKTFAKKGDSEMFLKDGYTDLRGVFDYFSLNTKETVDQIAILIAHDELGTLIRHAKPPPQ